jgi:hypothetical protein
MAVGPGAVHRVARKMGFRMDDREILSARVIAARLDLEKAAGAMAIYAPRGEAMASTWGSLQNRLAMHRAGIAELEESLGSQDVATSWAHLVELQAGLRATTKGVLALLQGGPLRDGEEQGGVYALADALVKEVAADLGKPWGGITLPGEREQLATGLSIIHLTFPQVSVWDLPIVLHEYGHEVAPEIRNELGQSPFVLMCRAAGSAVEKAHLTELFADAFASYTCGPAFACTLVVLRFDPTAEEALRDLPTHPSHDRRVEAALRVLARQARDVDDAAWTGLVEDLAASWRSSLKSSRSGSDVDDEPAAASASDPPRDPVSRLLDILALVPSASYRSWERTKRLVPLLAGRAQSRFEEDVTIRDALNAAWLARLRSPNDWSAIGDRAARLIRLIATGPARSASGPAAGHGGGVLGR